MPHKCRIAPYLCLWEPLQFCTGLQRLLQRLVEWAEFVEGCATLVRRLSGLGRSDPFSDGVSRQSGTLGYLMQRELVAEVYPPDMFPTLPC